MENILLIYIIFINIITFCAFGIDKYRAKKELWRIPESTLLSLAVLGGSVGAWGGMRYWRHKTKHKKFTLGIPLIMFAQVAIFFI